MFDHKSTLSAIQGITAKIIRKNHDRNGTKGHGIWSWKGIGETLPEGSNRLSKYLMCLKLLQISA